MRYLAALAFAGILAAQGTEPKHAAEEYDVHAKAGTAQIGAEYMVHSFSRGEQMFMASEYLVVEVALYPSKDETLSVQNSSFRLRVNGKKELLLTVPPQFVASSLRHPEWNSSPNGEVSARTNQGGIILGGPQRNPDPFPGSQPPGSQLPPRVPIPRENPTGITKDPVKPEQVLVETALVEGDHHAPFSGYLYFPYNGKVTGIKTLELLYQDAVLKIR